MSSRAHNPALTAATRSQNAFVQANLCSVIGRKGRHLNGTFCLTGDTMEGIIQCLVFLKAFSVRESSFSSLPLTYASYFARYDRLTPPSPNLTFFLSKREVFFSPLELASFPLFVAYVRTQMQFIIRCDESQACDVITLIIMYFIGIRS